MRELLAGAMTGTDDPSQREVSVALEQTASRDLAEPRPPGHGSAVVRDRMCLLMPLSADPARLLPTPR
jgi:hypothetical protein